MENNTESENSVKNIFNDVNYFALETDYTHRLINSDIIDRLIDNVIRPPEDQYITIIVYILDLELMITLSMNLKIMKKYIIRVIKKISLN